MKVKDIGTGNEISNEPPYFMKANALSNTISDLVTIEPENYPSYEADYKIELIMPNSKIPEDKNELKSSSTDLKKKNINIKRSTVPRRSPIPRKAKESPRQEEKKTITLIRNPKRKPRQASNNKSTSKKNSRTIRKIDKNNDKIEAENEPDRKKRVRDVDLSNEPTHPKKAALIKKIEFLKEEFTRNQIRNLENFQFQLANAIIEES